MFETNGSLGLPELEELMAKDMPGMTRRCVIITVLFILLACTYSFGTWPFTIILLLSLVPLYMLRSYKKRYITVNMSAIQRLSGGQNALPLSTTFEQDRVIMKIADAIPQVEILYSDLSRLIVTDHLLVLGSQTARKAVYVFKEELQDLNTFAGFLKSRNTNIPKKELSKLTEKTADGK